MSSMSDYLKKYLSKEEGGGNGKKKKKKAKLKTSRSNFTILDDDVDWQTIAPKDEDREEDPDDAPLVAEFCDEQDEILNPKWYPFQRETDHQEKKGSKPLGSRDLSPPRRQNDSDLSPPPDRCGSPDLSPPRRGRRHDIKPQREISSKRSGSSRSSPPDISPPRRRRQYDMNLKGEHTSMKGMHESPDSSPQRRKGYVSPDLSPPRSRMRLDSNDLSPPRRLERKADVARRTRNDPLNSNPSIKIMHDLHEVRRHTPDSSPPRRKRHEDLDLRPPRKRRHDSPHSSIREEPNPQDNSPPRKRKPNSPILPRKERHDLPDSSPPRKERHDSPDSSPPRRMRHDLPDSNPPRRKRHDSPDSNPPRRKRHDSPDASPPRRKRHDSPDASPPRRKRHDSPDANPPRRKRHDSPDASPPRRKRHDSPDLTITHSPHDLSPPRRTGSKGSKPVAQGVVKGGRDSKGELRMSSGASSGLQSADIMKEENVRARERQETFYKEMDAEVSGRHAETVRRDKEGKRIDPQLEKIQKRKEEMKKMAEDEKFMEWGRGVAQVRMAHEKVADELYEMSKPLARYADDEDLERMLKEREREGDPMLAFIKKKKAKTATSTGETSKHGKPTYKGHFPPNRFGIRPGYRWDGVNRSNGFEKALFARESNRKATAEESYKWSVEDM